MTQVKPVTFAIAGMHRSGTSLTASLLQSAGVDIGQRLMQASEGNIKGYFEDLDFVEFHESVLHSQGISTEGWTLESSRHVQEQYTEKAKSLIQERALKPFWGWKDPRTTLFLDFWAEIIPHAKFIFVYRSPWEVIDSLFRRGDKVFYNNPNFSLNLWASYNQKIIDFYDSCDARCLLLSIDNIKNNPHILNEVIRKKFNISLSQINSNIYEKAILNNQVFSSHRPSLIKSFFPEALKVYEELEKRTMQTNFSNLFERKENIEFTSYQSWLLQDWLDVIKAQRERQKAQLELQQTQLELQQRQATLKAMENSKFWKLQNKWVKLKEKFIMSSKDNNKANK